MSRTEPRWRAWLVALACLAVTSCSADLAFRGDTRLHFLTPANRSKVELPLTVRWTMRDFRGGPPAGGGMFAVLLDISPMPPGEDLLHFALDKRKCREIRASGVQCPSALELGEAGVHLTRDTSVTYEHIAARTGVSKAERDHHEVVVVLLDEHQRRIGEAAYYLEFTVKR